MLAAKLGGSADSDPPRHWSSRNRSADWLSTCSRLRSLCLALLQAPTHMVREAIKALLGRLYGEICMIIATECILALNEPPANVEQPWYSRRYA